MYCSKAMALFFPTLCEQVKHSSNNYSFVAEPTYLPLKFPFVGLRRGVFASTATITHRSSKVCSPILEEIYRKGVWKKDNLGETCRSYTTQNSTQQGKDHCRLPTSTQIFVRTLCPCTKQVSEAVREGPCSYSESYLRDDATGTN
jgi:hypothetical protein